MLCERSFKRFPEPPMNAMLAFVLMSACVVNVACLLGHL